MQTVVSVLLAATCAVGYGTYLLMAEFNQGKAAFVSQLRSLKAKQSRYSWNMPSGRFPTHDYKFTQV